jgi:hypothetical protein
MTMVSRLKKTLKKTAGTLALAAGITSVYFYAWGDVDGDRNRTGLSPDRPRTLVRLTEDLGSGRFSKSTLLSYDAHGDRFFALQLKPDLPAAPARPRDILVMIDTSASQAGFPLQVSRRLTEALMNDTAPNDRIAIMTVNTPRATQDLTMGLQEPKSAAVQSALKKLEDEYASGAGDLKNAFEQAVKIFENKTSRQQVIVFLGDCESAYNPLTEKQRLGIADSMVQANVGFFAVPLGSQINSKNLHSLVTGTGGAVVRFDHSDAKQANSDLTPVVKKINQVLAVPVLMPTNFKFVQAPAEIYPTKLPPLRADSSTLVIGRFEGKAPATVDLKIEGRIAGHETKVSVSEAMLSPIAENFFLPNLLTQWKQSDNPQAPALLRSDRTLALAYEQTRLAVDEMLNQADWAIGANQIEIARHLFTAAQDLKSDDTEAKAGLELVEKIKSGTVTPRQFRDALAGTRTGAAVEKGADGKVRMASAILEEIVKREDRLQDDPKPAPAAPKVAAGDDLLKSEQSRRVVLTQQI